MNLHLIVIFVLFILTIIDSSKVFATVHVKDIQWSNYTIERQESGILNAFSSDFRQTPNQCFYFLHTGADGNVQSISS